MRTDLKCLTQYFHYCYKNDIVWRLVLNFIAHSKLTFLIVPAIFLLVVYRRRFRFAPISRCRREANKAQSRKEKKNKDQSRIFHTKNDLGKKDECWRSRNERGKRPRGWRNTSDTWLKWWINCARKRCWCFIRGSSRTSAAGRGRRCRVRSTPSSCRISSGSATMCRRRRESSWARTRSGKCSSRAALMSPGNW